jgi:hypothetical protein
MKSYTFCQSCGIPLSKDPQNGGREKDGSCNRRYCPYCYQDGSFVSPKIDTPQKMQRFCIGQMKKQGMPKIAAWFFTRSIPRLERWK